MKARNRIIRQECRIPSVSEGVMLSCCMVYDERIKPLALLQLVHGMAEHKERYLPFMEAMAQRGFVCVIHDHSGHGKSVKRKEELGYFSERAEDLVEDVWQISRWAVKKFPALPLILFGHSMGSLAVREYCRMHEEALSALIVCGSPSYSALTPLAIGLTAFLKRLKGGRFQSRLLQRLAFSSYEKRFANEHLENAWLCSDPHVVQAYNASEYCGFIFSTQGFLALFRLLRRVYRKKWRCHQQALPILFLAGKEDACIQSERRFKQAVASFQAHGYQRIEAWLFDDMRHEVLNEKERLRVYEALAAWIRDTVLVKNK